MSWTSKVPDAITNLLSTLNAAAGLASVLVMDGPTVTSSPANEALTVGFTTENSPDAVTANVRPEGLSTTPNRETFTINCAIHVVRGDGNVAAARTRAYELFAIVGEAVAGNCTLDRAVMTATIGEHTLTQMQAQKGLLTELRFGVNCDAFTGRQ